MNNIIFNGADPLSFKALGRKIIALAYFWCQSRCNNSYLKLTMILSSNMKILPQQAIRALALELGLLLAMEESREYHGYISDIIMDLEAGNYTRHLMFGEEIPSIKEDSD